MALAPYFWPRNKSLTSRSLEDWPLPTTLPWPMSSTSHQSQISAASGGNGPDLLDCLILEEAKQKSKGDLVVVPQDEPKKMQGGTRYLLLSELSDYPEGTEEELQTSRQALGSDLYLATLPSGSAQQSLQAAPEKSKDLEKGKEGLVSSKQEPSSGVLTTNQAEMPLIPVSDFICQRFWNSGFCEYGEACLHRHTPRPVLEEACAESDNTDEVFVAAEKLSPKTSLNPFAKNFTSNKPSNVSANSWTPSFPNLGGQEYPSLTFIPSSFSSPPPTPALPTENMTVNINTSVPPPPVIKATYFPYPLPPLPLPTVNPAMLSQFDQVMRNWNRMGGRA